MRARNVCLACLALSLSAGAAYGRATDWSEDPGVRLELVKSETLSLLYFVEAALGAPSRSPYLRQVWERYGKSQRKDLEEIRQALASMPASWVFYEHAKESPTGRHLAQNVSSILEIMALHADSLDDLRTRMLGMLPIAEHARLFSGLAALQPLHRRWVWEPGQEQLKTAMRGLAAVGERVKTAQLLRQVARLYGARWPSGQSFKIGLVPVPKEAKQSTSFAHSIEAVEVVEVLRDDDWADRYGVIIHELAHSLYNAQALAVKLQLEKWFQESKSPVAQAAYSNIDEGLATAIGNGHATKLVKGEMRESWYNDPIIDAFGKALYPPVIDYMRQGKTIDKRFVQRAIALFQQQFPAADRMPRTLFSRVTMIAAEGIDLTQVYDAMRARVSMQSVQQSSPLDHPLTVKSYQQTSGQPCLFFLRRAQQEQLKQYDFAAAALPKINGGPNGSYYVATRTPDSRIKIFVIVGDEDQAAEVAGKLAALPSLEFDKAVSL